MSETGGPGAGGDDLASQAWVRAALEALRRDLHDELRTRRLVVTEPTGRAVVVVSCDADRARIEVASSDAPEATRIEIVVAQHPAEAYAGLALETQGDIVAELFVAASPGDEPTCRLVFEDPTRSRWTVVDRHGARREPPDASDDRS